MLTWRANSNDCSSLAAFLGLQSAKSQVSPEPGARGNDTSSLWLADLGSQIGRRPIGPPPRQDRLDCIPTFFR